MINEFVISILLLTAGLLTTVYVLLFFRQIRLKNSKRKLRRRLGEIAAYNGIEPSETDFFQYKILAYDELNNKIIFVDEATGEEAVVDLNYISECRLIQKQLSSQLELVLKEGYEESICIPFYRRSYDRKSLRKKLEKKAERWKETINDALLRSDAAPAL